MPLTIKSRIEGNFAILEIAGKLTLGPALAALREEARKILGTRKLEGIVLHVSGVSQADSAGLGELTAVYSLATRRGCPIRLVNPPPQLKKMLEMTHLDGLLPCASDIASAKTEMARSLSAL